MCIWNSDGVQGKEQEPFNFMLAQDIDIMMVQETKINPSSKL